MITDRELAMLDAQLHTLKCLYEMAQEDWGPARISAICMHVDELLLDHPDAAGWCRENRWVSRKMIEAEDSTAKAAKEAWIETVQKPGTQVLSECLCAGCHKPIRPNQLWMVQVGSGLVARHYSPDACRENEKGHLIHSISEVARMLRMLPGGNMKPPGGGLLAMRIKGHLLADSHPSMDDHTYLSLGGASMVRGASGMVWLSGIGQYSCLNAASLLLFLEDRIQDGQGDFPLLVAGPGPYLRGIIQVRRAPALLALFGFELSPVVAFPHSSSGLAGT